MTSYVSSSIWEIFFMGKKVDLVSVIMNSPRTDYVICGAQIKIKIINY